MKTRIYLIITMNWIQPACNMEAISKFIPVIIQKLIKNISKTKNIMTHMTKKYLKT